MGLTKDNNEGKFQDVSEDLTKVGRWRASGSEPSKSRDSKDFYITPKNLELREVIKAEK